MALLYDPGKFMPDSEDTFDSVSWMLTWPDGPWHLHDVDPGGTVYLVRADSVQEIVWETRVAKGLGLRTGLGVCVHKLQSERSETQVFAKGRRHI